ncbi:putative nuclease HARBI1 [Maniola jurtina]|uniref:putative nuclease HARBI1 n=1 Tax=Maniola jurtina TaxID=191418 RepID=UPI001E688C07|nr:putative nuclease HARBI1 [Maniola jurtina]XP_045764675.1 putative nuclease HARBI1 [Maniola jurtina]XP_045778531.1 putative nuclease HARBI1 [Maniola jurtina]XP_045781802.1 putative nuclease HARBI1 [Maniola jurtina]
MDRKKKEFKRVFNRLLPDIIKQLWDLLEDEDRRIWTRTWILRRTVLGATNSLFNGLQSEDPKEFKALLRMTVERFETLLENITPYIQRQDTILREAIPAKVKLQVTLSYLAAGISYRYLQAFYRVSRSAISVFIPEVLDAIVNYLELYVRIPDHNEWQEIEDGFRTRWNFPGCHGAIDGKHVLIDAPPNSGSEYFNYKGSNSIVLLAVVDHDYCFRYLNVGANGRNSDAGIFRQSSLRHSLENNLLPKGGFLVGDDAFALKTYLLKPYSGTNLTTTQKIFNYRLSRARRIVENGFGILASRFQIFQRRIPTDVDTTDKIIRASCALHNWLRKTSSSTYFRRGCVDEEDTDSGTITEGSWRRELINNLPNITDHNTNYAGRVARDLRNKYAEYFSGPGAVPWQNRMIN